VERALLATACALLSLVPTSPASATPRPIQMVLLGGSVAAHPANFGKFVHYGCRNVQVHNRAQARLKASHLLRRLDSHVLADAELMTQVRRGKPWLLYLGGLNGIYRPERTRKNIALTFEKAHAAGFQVMAITLHPWGAATDRRWRDFEGLHKMRSTRLVNDFLQGKDRTGWPATRRPDKVVDAFNSGLRDRRAALRSAEEIAPAFATSRYRNRRPMKRWIQAARRVPRNFMRKRYRGRYHFHPNWRGQRIIARLICKQAPAEWGCDCERIRRSWSKDRIIRP